MDYFAPVAQRPNDEERDDFDPEHGESGEGRDEVEGDDDRRRPRMRRKLTDSLLTSLLEGGAAIKRGQDRVSGVAQGTKEELLRLVGTEVRGFLDKIDVVDMMQKVVSGLVIDVNAQIRIRRDEEGKLETEVSRQDIRLGGDKREKSGEKPGDETRDDDAS